MATTWYAANAGSNSNNGTGPGTPFQTFAHAVSVALAGDTILLNGGDTFTESVTIAVVLAGIASYGTGDATCVSTALTSTTISCTTAGGPPGFLTSLNIQGTSSVYANTGAHGFSVTTTGTTVFAGCVITGCNFSNIPLAGILFTHTSVDNGGVTGVTISNCTFDHIGGVAIQLYNNTATQGSNYNYSGVTISNCTISNILGNTSASGTAFGWGINLQFTNISAGASSVHDNIIHDLAANENAAQAGAGTAFQCEGCNGVQVYNNLAYNLFNTTAAGSDGAAGFDIDANNQNCVCHNNYVYNADGPALSFYSNGGTFTGNVFHHNIGVNVARNTALGGVFISGTSPYVLYANTISVSGSKPVICFVGSFTPTAKFLNNCFVAPAGVPTVLVAASTTITSMVMDGNYHESGDGLFLCTDATGTQKTTLASWKTDTGFETSGVAAGHCHFVQPLPPPTTLSGAGFGLAPAGTSPLIGAGANLLGTYGITPAADYNGTAWTQNCIGAIYTVGSSTNYAGAVYARNPLGWWRLAEASGSAIAGDSIGTFSNAVASNVTFGGGTLAQGDGSPTSASFNGTSGEVTGVAIASTTYALSAMSIAVTFTPTAVNVASQVLVESYNAGAATFDWFLRLVNNTLGFQVRDNNGNSTSATFPTNLVAGTTYTAVVTWTGTTMTCYLGNGTSFTPSYTAQATNTTVPITQVVIGYSHPGAASSWFGGVISEVNIYPSVITQTQAQTLFSNLTFAPGTATAGSVTSSSISVSATDASGGATPYTYQWQQSTDNVTWSSASGTGVTTRSATVTGLTSSTTYFLRLQYTDANSIVVDSASVSATTSSGGGGSTAQIANNVQGVAGAMFLQII